VAVAIRLAWRLAVREAPPGGVYCQRHSEGVSPGVTSRLDITYLNNKIKK